MSTLQTRSEVRGSGLEETSVQDIESGPCIEESSSCEELEKTIVPLESPEQYADFVKTIVEIIRISVKVAPQKATSIAKLAVDLMLTDNTRVYSNLHRIFVPSVRQTVTADPQKIRTSLTEGESNLKRKQVQQLVERAEEYNKKLEENFEKFSNFDCINDIVEDSKRQIERRCFTECSKSLKDSEVLLKKIDAQIFELAQNKLRIDSFLRMNQDLSADFACSLLIREIEFAKGSDLITSIYGKLSLDFVSTVKGEIKRRRNEFEEYQLQFQNRNPNLECYIELFRYAYEFLVTNFTNYLDSAGTDYVETMSILGINLCMSKNLEEAEGGFAQLKVFAGKHVKNDELDKFGEFFLDRPQLFGIHQIFKKLIIQSDCLKVLQCTASGDKKDEFSNPLTLVDKTECERLMTKFEFQSLNSDPFKKWPEEEKSRFIALFLLRAIVAKTGFLTSFENQLKESLNKRVMELAFKAHDKFQEMFTRQIGSSESKSGEQDLSKETETESEKQFENDKEEIGSARSDI